MEKVFETVFEDSGKERCLLFLLLLLSKMDPDLLKQTNFTNHERNMFKKASEKLQKQSIVKEFFAVQLLESYFLFIKN